MGAMALVVAVSGCGKKEEKLQGTWRCQGNTTTIKGDEIVTNLESGEFAGSVTWQRFEFKDGHFTTHTVKNRVAIADPVQRARTVQALAVGGQMADAQSLMQNGYFEGTLNRTVIWTVDRLDSDAFDKTPIKAFLNNVEDNVVGKPEHCDRVREPTKEEIAAQQKTAEEQRKRQQAAEEVRRQQPEVKAQLVIETINQLTAEARSIKNNQQKPPRPDEIQDALAEARRARNENEFPLQFKCAAQDEGIPGDLEKQDEFILGSDTMRYIQPGTLGTLFQGTLTAQEPSKRTFTVDMMNHQAASGAADLSLFAVFKGVRERDIYAMDIGITVNGKKQFGSFWCWKSAT